MKWGWPREFQKHVELLTDNNLKLLKMHLLPNKIFKHLEFLDNVHLQSSPLAGQDSQWIQNQFIQPWALIYSLK